MWLQKREFIVYSDRMPMIDREGINELDVMKPPLLLSGCSKFPGKDGHPYAASRRLEGSSLLAGQLLVTLLLDGHSALELPPAMFPYLPPSLHFPTCEMRTPKLAFLNTPCNNVHLLTHNTHLYNSWSSGIRVIFWESVCVYLVFLG